MSRFSDKVKKNGKKCTFCDISMSNIGLIVDHIGVQHDQVEIQEIILSLFRFEFKRWHFTVVSQNVFKLNTIAQLNFFLTSR
jgi:hypothetical protein